MILLRARFHPRRVLPRVAVHVEDHRARLRTHLRIEPVRIRLQRQRPARPQNFKFVDFAFGQRRDKKFPHAAQAAQPHGMHAPIPVIEVAHHAHAPRIRRPHAELHAAHPGDVPHMRAQPLVFFVVRAFADQMQVEIGQQRREGVRVVGDLRAPALIVNFQFVAGRRLVVQSAMRFKSAEGQ